MLPNDFLNLPDTAFVTALPKEFAALTAVFDENEEFSHSGDPNDYMIGVVYDDEGRRHFFPIAMLKKMGNNSAAAAARDVLRTFPGVQNIIMVGIAGGVPHPNKPEEHVRLGDIVVSSSRGVVQFDRVKLSNGQIDIRDSSQPPSAQLIGLINRIEADRIAGFRPWEEYTRKVQSKLSIKRPNARFDRLVSTNNQEKQIEHPQQTMRRAGQPMVHYGTIGSSNTLLKDAKVRDALRNDESVVAIEMEGSGIADGSWQSGNGYLLIRGICDYADQTKTDKWQEYAAIVAASYARCVVDGIVRSSVVSTESAKKKLNEILAKMDRPRYLGYSAPVPIKITNRKSRVSVDLDQDNPNTESLLNSLVIGGQGSGKSSICAIQYEHLYQAYSSSVSDAIPVYFDLELDTIQNIRSTIDSVIENLGDKDADDDVEEKYKIVVIMDAFDRSEERKEIVEFVIASGARRRQLSFTIFSRDIVEARSLSEILREIRIEPLTDRQIQEIIGRVSEGKIPTSDLFFMIEQGIIEALRTPFMATLFALTYVEDVALVDLQSDIAVYKMIERLDQFSLANNKGKILKGNELAEALLAKEILRGKSSAIKVSENDVEDIITPFLYKANREIRFRHEIFRDYFVTKAAANELSLIGMIRYIFRDRYNQNLSFLAFSLHPEKSHRMLKFLSLIVDFTIRSSVFFFNRRNPFLYLYIKVLLTMKADNIGEQLIDKLISRMTEDASSFPFAYYMPKEIRGPDYDDFRLQNSYYLIGQLGSPRFREYLFDRSRGNVDRYSIFGLLAYRDESSAQFLIDAIDETGRKINQKKGFHDITGVQYATSVIARFPFHLFPKLLYEHVCGERVEAVRQIISSFLHILARHNPEKNTKQSLLEFEEESYLRVTHSAEWLDFFFYCFTEGDHKLSRTSLGCLKNHNWGGPIRKDIEERLRELCSSERASVRRRAVFACVYIPDTNDIIEHVLQFEQDMSTCLAALNAAWLTKRPLFFKYGVSILFENSLEGYLPKDKVEVFFKYCGKLFDERSLPKDEEKVAEMIKCTVICVNAPTDAMRSWGLELLAQIDEQLATKIGEWIILNGDELADEEHGGIFRSLHNIDCPVSAEVVLRGLEAEKIEVIAVVINCVDEDNLTNEVRTKLLTVRENIPGGWGHLRNTIDQKLAGEGSYRAM